jgi:hypothetical protein
MRKDSEVKERAVFLDIEVVFLTILLSVRRGKEVLILILVDVYQGYHMLMITIENVGNDHGRSMHLNSA